MNLIVGIDIGFLIPESGPEWGGAADNRIIENNVTRNNLGIILIYSKNNTIFHNNVEENNSSVAIIGSYFNIWDDGAIGNHWSDYNGTDANHDNIGDTPYFIDANNRDRYPLMPPYIIPEFSSFLTILLFAMATLLVVIFYRRKHVQRAPY
jgi:parallel beta-helix repeat protein